MDNYMEKYLERMDEIIQELRDMHERNLELIEESREVIDAHNAPVALSRPESRVQKDDE